MNILNLCALYTAALVTMVIAGRAVNRTAEPLDIAPQRLTDVRNFAGLTPSPKTNRPSVALVLGGGGLRGFAHVGVLPLDHALAQPEEHAAIRTKALEIGVARWTVLACIVVPVDDAQWRQCLPVKRGYSTARNLGQLHSRRSSRNALARTCAVYI